MSQTDTDTTLRPLEWWEQRELEHNGCSATDWSRVSICDATALGAIRRTRFIGDVSIGAVDATADEGIFSACLQNCAVGNHVLIRNIGNALRNCAIGDNTQIIDTELIDFEPETRCGIGTLVSVLDETGSRPVTIFPGMSAQLAVLMARMPKWSANHLQPLLSTPLLNFSAPQTIGRNVRIIGCGPIVNVHVDDNVRIEGAASLSNGTIVNNAAAGKELAYIGHGVQAENFVIEDGCVDSGAIVHNCFVGQGVTIANGFTAHDSLFFANCHLENGEACAVFAGPYTVSMHKSSLLIGCQTSFMNAGSGTNQSNHMYKMGPVHWGVLERGVKTSSLSYLMLGAKIGAFSLLMGQHKTHPDSSQFPFSYLFGDERGSTVVVPAMMLRSCGLLRDEQKWPSRDKRVKRRMPLRDRVIFDVLNPMTVDSMMTAHQVILDLLARPADDDRVIRYRGMKFTRASLERAIYLYELGIYKYLSIKMPNGFIGHEPDKEYAEWVDVAGLLMRRQDLNRVLECESIADMEAIFTEAFNNYSRLEREWIVARTPSRWRKSAPVIREYAQAFDKMVAEDRARNLADLEALNQMLAL